MVIAVALFVGKPSRSFKSPVGGTIERMREKGRAQRWRTFVTNAFDKPFYVRPWEVAKGFETESGVFRDAWTPNLKESCQSCFVGRSKKITYKLCSSSTFIDGNFLRCPLEFWD